MKIYDKRRALILDVIVDDNSYRNRVVMGDHNLTLYYSLSEHVEIPVGAFCIYEGETYTLMRPEQLKMKHTRYYEYTVEFSSEQEKAKIWKFRNPVDGRLKFPLTAKPKEHIEMFVDNMNRRDTGWTVGDCIDDVEKLISYDHDFCWDALSKIATEFKTEFEIVGKRVSLKKVEYNKSQPLAIAYGRGNGFKPGVGRSNTSEALPVEILFVQGGDTNIDRSKYPDSEQLRAISNGCLLLPTGQIIAYDGEHFEGEDAFNSVQARRYQVDDLGLSIRNIDKELTSQAEDSLDRSDDYPKRVGTISSVVMVDKDKNFYDIIDNSIPADLNYEDYLIGEDEMTIIFQTGELAGKEFDVKYYHDSSTSNGKTKAGRRFEIIPQEIDGVMMPGDSFVPHAGDTYAVFHVMLPDAYIRNDATKSGASWDMFRAAVRYLFDNEQKKFSFTGELDSMWAKKNWLNVGGQIRLGGYIQFKHDEIAPEGVLVRIVSIKDYVNKPHSPKIELSNDTISASVSSTLKQLASTEVVIDENHRSSLQFTKRRFRDAKETIEMIESALSDNFTNRINPIAVETMSLLVGDERLQYQFVEAPGNTTAVPHNITFHEDTKQLEAPAGTIQHLTLGIDSIRPSHEPNEYLYWNVGAFLSPALTDGSAKYYLYIRAQKQYNGAAGSAEFRLETITHKLEEGSYYWLLVGVLNTEYDGERSFATLYGFTEILPGRITADRLLASDGESYFDMLNAAMKLKDKLVFNKDGDGELRIKGVIVQSQNGLDEAPLGCFRGEYSNTATYFNGDEVTYRLTENSPKSTYRCVSPTPILGIPPLDTLKWQVTAAGIAGEDGKDGQSITLKGAFIQIFQTETAYENSITKTGEVYLINHLQSDEGKPGYIRTGQRPSLEGALQGNYYNTAADGDAWVSSTNGHLYVADEHEGWIDAGVFQGKPGNYTEYRYQISGSSTIPPALNQDSRNPDGWNTIIPDLTNTSQFLWATKARINGATEELLESWCSPFRMSAQDGTPGKSPVLVFRGPYDPQARYYGNEYRVDAVRYNNAFYIARIDAPQGTGGFINIAPHGSDAAQYWNPFGGSFESVATSLLLAELATIGNWFISGSCICSTHGTDADGNSSDDFSSSGFSPDIILDGSTGKLKFGNDIELNRKGLILYDNAKRIRLRILNESVGGDNNIRDGVIQQSKQQTLHSYIPNSGGTASHENLQMAIDLGFLDIGATIYMNGGTLSVRVPFHAVNSSIGVSGTITPGALKLTILRDGTPVAQTSSLESISASKGETLLAMTNAISYKVTEGNEGKYELKLECSAFGFKLSDSSTGSLQDTSVELSVSGNFSHGSFSKMIIGNDGFFSRAEECSILKQQDRFIVKAGDNILEVSKDGIKANSRSL